MKNLFSLSKLLLGLPLWLCASRAAAQAPTWQDAIAVGSTGATTVDASAPDASGNLYVAGTFRATATFGGTTLTSAGSTDVYVAKWSAATNSFAWAVRLGGSGLDEAFGLAVSGSSVYLAGDFSGTAAVGGTTLTSAGSTDAFVAKLTDAGTSASFAWAQQAGGTSGEFGYGVAVNGSSVYLAGFYGSPSITAGGTTLTNAGSSDCFVAKLTDGGSAATFNWVLGAGGTGSDEAYSLAVSGSNVYVAGASSSPALALGGTTLATAGDYDAFVAKITDAGATGSYTWAQRLGGTDSDGLARITASGSAVYAVGGFASSSLAAGSSTLTSAGGFDALLVKLTDAGSTGSIAWAQRGGSAGDDIAYGVAERNGNVYVTGFFGDTDTGGTTLTATFGSQTLTSVGGSDVFVARVRDGGAAGTFSYAQRAGGPGNDIAYTTALAASRLYVGGEFAGASATFGTTTLVGSTFGSTGFLAYLLDPALATAPVAQLPGVALYPNPARGSATVQLPAGVAAPQVSLTLLDALGRPLRTHTVPAAGRELPLDLAGLVPGLYAVRVQAGGTQATHRLVVE